MKYRTSVAWEAAKPPTIEEVNVDDPKQRRVLVRIVATAVCHTDAFTVRGEDPVEVFTATLAHEGGGVVEVISPSVTSVAVGDHIKHHADALYGR